MGLLDWFRRKPPIATRADLADFIDRQSAFLAQKGVYEYSRARAGPHANMLFGERSFQDALERARWQAFPLGLGMTAEMAEGVLRPHAGPDPGPMRAGLSALVVGVFNRYRRPPSQTEEAWTAAREGVVQSLAAAALHPVKPVMQVPEPFVDRYLALMPIHDRLRDKDRPTVRNYLIATLCNSHDDLVRRADPRALVAALQGEA